MTSTMTNGNSALRTGKPNFGHSALRTPHSALTVDTYPAPTADAVRRLYQHGQDRGLSLARLAGLLDRDPSLVSKLFHGKYPAGDLEPITAHINKVLASGGTPALAGSDIISQTSVVQSIEELCLLAWLRRRICFIFGPTQSGKTTGIAAFRKQYRQHPRHAKGVAGRIHYYDVPSNGSARSTLNEMARAHNFGQQCNWSDQKLRVFNAVEPNDLCIFDEFSQCFNPVTGTVRLATIRLARELWNKRRCGMVFVMTDIGKNEMQTSKFKKACDELWFRCAAELELDRVPSDDDLKLITADYGLPAPNATMLTRIRDLVRARGMTRYTTLLEMAGAEAATRAGHTLSSSGEERAGRGVAPTWVDFMTVHDIVARFAKSPSQRS